MAGVNNAKTSDANQRSNNCADSAWLFGKARDKSDTYNAAMDVVDVCVRGTGIVGHALALSLARRGLRIALLSRAGGDPPAAQDVRAYALNAASVNLLRSLKVWDALPPDAATAVYDMRIHGDAPGAVLEFSAWQQRVAELAWIVDAPVLERELANAVRFSPHVQTTQADVSAPLTALCEGQDSATRERLGIEVERNRYGHRALAARLVSTTPHLGVARQWFGSPDVLALLPIDQPEAGRSWALVWSMPDAQADERMALPPEAFEQALRAATSGAAGSLALVSDRMTWPLARSSANTWSGPGWALLGDAAHQVHPLAGQGLNLGLADVAALTRVLAEREPWRPLGDAKLLRRYARDRAAATWAMGTVTDGLLRLFAGDGQPLRELRNRGLNLVNRTAPLKRWLTGQALGG